MTYDSSTQSFREYLIIHPLAGDQRVLRLLNKGEWRAAREMIDLIFENRDLDKFCDELLERD